MADLTIMDQKAYQNDILPKMLLLKEQLDLRADVWSKVSPEKKRQWITSGEDPLMTLAFQMGQYFKDNFPELLEDY